MNDSYSHSKTMLTALVYFHISMRKSKIKLNIKERVYLAYISQHLSSERNTRSLTQCETLEAKIEVMIMEEYDLLACSPGLAQPAFFFNSVTCSHWWHCPRWAGSFHISL